MAHPLLRQFGTVEPKADSESTTLPLATNAASHMFTAHSAKADDFQTVPFDRIYGHRYTKLREFYANYASSVLNEQLTKVYNLEPENMLPVLLCGTINRKMRQMESFVKEIQKPEFAELSYQRPKELSTAADIVILEDETGKVELRESREVGVGGGLRVHNLTTGCVVLVRGCVGLDQKLQVSEVILAKLPECLFRETRTLRESSGPKKKFLSGQPKGRQFTLVSGLRLTAARAESRQYRLLRSFLGRQRPESAEGVQTLVAFGGLSDAMEGVNLSLYYYHYYAEHFARIQSQFTESLRAANELFREFLDGALGHQTREVVLVPTITDPTFGGLPQPPFQKKLFEGAGTGNSLFLLPNPAVIEVFPGSEALVWDGVNVADFAGQSGLAFEEAAEAMVLMRLSAPTCPNTLETFALDDCDSLILETIPSFVVVGNAPHFSTRKVDSVQCTLVFVPDFSKSGQVVIFDAENASFAPVTVK